jgi:hypothetical protein
MAENLPRSTSELLAVIEKEWNELMRAVDRLTPEQMMRPDSGGWSPKDNLAHLTEWMAYMRASYLQKVPAHEAMRIPAEKLNQLDEDGINAVLFERNRQRTIAHVLEGLKSTYADVVETLRAMPFPDLMKPLRESGPDKRLVIESVLGNTSEHFLEHRKVIEKILP